MIKPFSENFLFAEESCKVVCDEAMVPIVIETSLTRPGGRMCKFLQSPKSTFLVFRRTFYAAVLTVQQQPWAGPNTVKKHDALKYFFVRWTQPEITLHPGHFARHQQTSPPQKVLFQVACRLLTSKSISVQKCRMVLMSPFQIMTGIFLSTDACADARGIWQSGIMTSGRSTNNDSQVSRLSSYHAFKDIDSKVVRAHGNKSDQQAWEFQRDEQNQLHRRLAAMADKVARLQVAGKNGRG